MIKPMLATLVDQPFDGDEWVFETKWDGYRMLAEKKEEGNRTLTEKKWSVKLLSRSGQRMDQRFPEIGKELALLPGSFVLDGEVVILDSKGRSHFQLLQNYQKNYVGTPYYYVFDILMYEGKDLRHKTLLERKAILERLLKTKRSSLIKYSAHREKKGKLFFKEALKRGLEGIVAKRKDSQYVNKRSRSWLKIKTMLRQEVVIGGFTEPRGSRSHFGALLVGVYEKDKLRFCGRVGGGFDRALLKDIYAELKKLVKKSSPFVEVPFAGTWVRPQLVAEVSFAEWTNDGMMRQPIFCGLRSDKKAKEVAREKPRRYGKVTTHTS